MHDKLWMWIARGITGLVQKVEDLLALTGQLPRQASDELIEAARKILRLMGVN